MTAPAADPYPPGFEPYIAAIQADVETDLPRLAFADWLDDHGDPDRAEFIRLQCRHAGWDPGVLSMSYFTPHLPGPAWPGARDRMERLYYDNYRRWFTGIPETDVRPQAARWTEFQRGFVGRFKRTPAELVGDDWLALRRITPVQGLWVPKVGHRDVEVLRSDRVPPVSLLSLSEVSAAAVPGLADAPVLASLRRLFLFGNGKVDAGSFARLLGSPGLGNVTELRLGGFKPGDAVADAVVGSKSLGNVRDLTLIDAPLTADGFGRLAATPLFRRLKRLDLSSGTADEAVVRVLVGLPRPPKLEELHLSWNRLGPEAFRLLAGWPGLSTVRTLRLHRNNPGVEGLRAFGASPHAGRLTTVDLPDVNTSADVEREIEALPLFVRLRRDRKCRLDGGPRSD